MAKNTVAMGQVKARLGPIAREESPWVIAWRKGAGVLPLALFCLAFEIVPLILLVFGSLQSSTGGLTLGNYGRALQNRLYLLL